MFLFCACADDNKRSRIARRRQRQKERNRENDSSRQSTYHPPVHFNVTSTFIYMYVSSRFSLALSKVMRSCNIEPVCMHRKYQSLCTIHAVCTSRCTRLSSTNRCMYYCERIHLKYCNSYAKITQQPTLRPWEQFSKNEGITLTTFSNFNHTAKIPTPMA